ncbi:hypothetical protein G7Y89_g7829 [Cudoniella acicularis]|uniref:Homeobox domain-containing protein n=1 Tax=Cudoniella acicularis TaxID=354080 RepID=A0A8H4W3F5_9HELO|nr:hypothetical protein G7Y89_g7829 [Cudoniella acicularis]
MPNMEYHDQAFQHYSHHVEQMSAHTQGMSQYTEAQNNMHNYMAHQSASMMAMAPSAPKTNETKPRLGKDEVDILEREFKKNPKPSTQTKRQFAEDMGVDLARINVCPDEKQGFSFTDKVQNWFQNRRAKRKQEKKQEAYEAGQAQEAMGYSDTASSPDFFNGNGYFSDSHVLPMQQQPASFPMVSGPPPAVASYNPQYSDPSSASLESLQRTIAAAQAAPHSEYHNYVDQNGPLSVYADSLMTDSSNGDRAQFPPSDSSIAQFDNQSYSYPSSFSNIYNSPQSVNDIRNSPIDTVTQTPTPFNAYSNSSGPDSNSSQSMTAFPSQLLPLQEHDLQEHDSLPSLSNDTSDTQSSEDDHVPELPLDFKYDVTESESSISPPAPSIPFKSPAPMDIASRRKKVHSKPAALVAETLRNRPSMGPRTVSHADGFRRPVESPMASPMRRIVSAGGNRNVISGRICKPGVESAQRSPINLGGFADAGAFMEHNFHSIRNPPSLTALSSLNSSLAPPTPMSPREREMTLVKREGSRSTASPQEGNMSFVFNAGVPGYFTTMEGDQNLASPPETPQAQVVAQTVNGWSNSMEFHEKQWRYEVPDEPLYTPAQDGFPVELQMPQPTYIANMSQPVTPAFGQFNPNFIFGHESPQYKNESPQYTLSTQSSSEYCFPDAQGHFPLGLMTSPSMMTKQKTFQFSNTTAADFSEK